MIIVAINREHSSVREALQTPPNASRRTPNDAAPTPKNRKGSAAFCLAEPSRGERIRTSDPLTPSQVR